MDQVESVVETKLYWGNMEKLTKGSTTYEVYYLAAGNGLNNIIVKQGSAISIYYTYTDQLGSIVAITNKFGDIEAEQNFDAWGRKRNPANWTYTGVPATPDWLYRGYTGHENLVALNLINMNGRMYDPMTGLMMSPDNYVPLPFSLGGYNRYLYANGNPLKFVDPDGEFFWFPVILGAVIGGNTNGIAHVNKGGSFLGGFWRGALVGAAAGIIGGGVANLAAGGSFFGNAAAKTVGFWAGAGSGAAGGAAGGFVGSAGSAWINGASFNQGLWIGIKGGVIGGIIGGISNGITSQQRKITIESAGKVKATDEFLKKAQKTWYPDAPMNKVKDFTVEHPSLEALDEFFRNPAVGGATIPEVNQAGNLTGYSSVYFNPNVAFETSKTLYFTMGHEFIHVSQFSVLAGQSFSYVSQNLRQMMEFQAYMYEAYLGRPTLNSFSQTEIHKWLQDPWYNKLMFWNNLWLNEARYNYIYIK